MKVLIACKFSGTVRDAFTKAGYDATSCDLLPTEAPGKHHQGDVREILDAGWDLMIAHPDCTYLTCSAEWAYKDEQTKRIKPGTLIGAARRKARDEAAAFFMELMNAPIPHIAIENPVGVMSSRYRKADQCIQPYQFGHDASKRTCFWLKDLPKLNTYPVLQIPGEYGCSCGVKFPLELGKYGCPNCHGDGKVREVWGNQTPTGQNKLGPSARRWMDRAETYNGIAFAMARDWGNWAARKTEWRQR